MHNYVSPENELSPTKVRTAIVGARGYSGLELAKILLDHPRAELAACYATDPDSFQLKNEIFSRAAEIVPTLCMDRLIQARSERGIQVVFLATPAEASQEWAPRLLELGMDVIDLSGAFRLPASLYPQWYGFEHRSPKLLDTAIYGLAPFSKSTLSRQKGPVLVANPGCYVTSVLMALLPLLQERVLTPESVVIDAKSGTTGGGKKPTESLLFSEVDGECLPYKVGHHQHYPEICHFVRQFSGVEFSPHFSTSLLPTPRGIITAIYGSLSIDQSEKSVENAYQKHYQNYPLARIERIAPGSKNLSLKQVVGSDRVQISYLVDTDPNGKQKLYVYSLIDNLRKGAASQAIENFNSRFHFPIGLGLKE